MLACRRGVKNQAQLITYVDRLSGGGFRDLSALLHGPLAHAFGGLHVLPFFHPIDGADAGFDPIDHTSVDARLGTWEDVVALASQTDLVADLIVNHISRHSPQFRDYDRRGPESPFAELFLRYDSVFPDGARARDLAALHTLRATLPFTKHRSAGGVETLLWTTFTSDQIDIDVRRPVGRRYLSDVLACLQTAGVAAIRLDAVGHAVKVAGTSCFMIPETFVFIDELTAEAHSRGMEVLVEVHGHVCDQLQVAQHVDWVYDFALPPLVLHALYTGDTRPLVEWLEVRPTNAMTVLDTHDGIGVVDVAPDPTGPGRPGLLSADAVSALVETIHQRSRGESRLASGSASSNLDDTQVNCTYYDALGRRDAEYLIARAIQCFVPGIPQIYYVGVLAGTNDLALLRRTGVGRDINRHYYSADELARDLARPVVQSLLALLRLRNQHAAFGGTCRVLPAPQGQLVLRWDHGDQWAQLDADVRRMVARVTSTGPDAREGSLAWQAADER
jgi:sucrose phosphorylase